MPLIPLNLITFQTVSDVTPSALTSIFPEPVIPREPSTLRLSFTLGGTTAICVRATSIDGSHKFGTFLDQRREFQPGITYNILGCDMALGYSYNVEVSKKTHIQQMSLIQMAAGTTGGYSPSQGDGIASGEEANLLRMILCEITVVNTNLMALRQAGQLITDNAWEESSG